jgi:RNA polymerase sigma factor (sigma-70 family)
MKSTILRSTAALQSDNRLVEMVRAGVEPAFDTIVTRYRSPLLRYASRMVDPDRAEDVVQEALMKAHGSLLQDDREIQLKPWLYRITHNLALDAVRQKSWNYDQLDDNYDGVRQPPDCFEQKERLRSIIEHMDTLPERQRRALILQAFEGRSSEEIARELDDGVPEARQLVHRARVRMRNAFGGLIPIPVLLWLHQGSASAATAKASGSKLLLGGGVRTGVAKFATTAAVAVAVGAGAGVVVGETTIKDGGSAQQVADVSPTGDDPASTGSGGIADSANTSRANAGRSGSQDTADALPGDSGPSNGTPEGGANGADHSPSDNTDSTPAPGSGRDPGPSTDAPSKAPAGGDTGSGDGSGGGTGGGPSDGGGSGGGSSGGGSGGGSSGGGGGSTDPGGDQTCIGPIAQLPPICLPAIGGGGGSGPSLPSLP